jgi:spermidine synthase
LSLIGFTAVIAQIVAMRELIVVFYGNELSLGVMLANWLFWTALGSSGLGRLTQRVRDSRRLMAGLEALLAAAFPLTILAVRTSKSMFHSLPGEILGPGPMFLTSLLTLSVFCLFSGGLFAAGSRLYAAEVGASTARATSAVYLWEAVGSGLGGILASLLFIRFLTPFQIALLLSLLNLLAAVALGVPPGRVTYRRALAGAVIALGFFLPFAARRLESTSLSLLWQGWRLVETRNSIYGNLAVVEAGESRSLFENGLRVLTVPDPAAAEEAVHYALLEHPSPRTLLLIGGGVNGSLAQALQHPSLERADYVELDPTILDLAARHFSATSASLRSDRRVRVHHLDGRLFLKRTDSSYDVIIVNLPDPYTAQLNRFYTEEFFREAAQKLNPGGILSFQVTSAENYISRELADFLRCVLKTLRVVFPEVAAIPGETAHFFAAKNPGTLAADSSELLSRLRSRGLRTSYVREYYIPFRLSPDRMLDLQLQIEPQPETPVNRDFAPIAYYFDVELWSTRFHPGPRTWFGYLARLKFTATAGALAALLFAFVAGAALFDRRRGSALGERRDGLTVGFCVAAMGFTLLGLEILLLLGFQALYGYVYHQLAILVALFMLGMAVGTRLALPAVASTAQITRRAWLLLAALQLLAAASPVFLYRLFSTLGQVRGPAGLFLVSQVLFPVLAFLSGALGGYQFPLASRVYFQQSSRSPGVLYALDLIGACLGAVALSTFLVPVFGFLRAALLMAMVNLAPAALAALAASGGPALPPRGVQRMNVPRRRGQ